MPDLLHKKASLIQNNSRSVHLGILIQEQEELLFLFLAKYYY